MKNTITKKTKKADEVRLDVKALKKLLAQRWELAQKLIRQTDNSDNGTFALESKIEKLTDKIQRIVYSPVVKAKYYEWWI
jgi:hypothetical protein